VSDYIGKSTRSERRLEQREMHIDRRKSGVDVLERVMLSGRRGSVRTISHDRAPRSRTKK
jgi:hypothetical protein